MEGLFENPIILTLAIFLARVVDVSLGTVRSLLVFRGYKYAAALIGFIETLIWVVAVSQVIKNLDTWYLAVSYAGGFAVGNIVGISLENKLAIGTELVRAVSKDASIELAGQLRSQGYEVIELAGEGDDAPVEVLLIVQKRRGVPKLLRSIDSVDPTAYCTISDVRDRVRHTSHSRRVDPSVAGKLKRK